MELVRSEKTVHLLNRRLINGEDEAASSGYFGSVYAVDVQFPGRRGKTYPMALKEFTNPDSAAAQAAADNAVQRYLLGKRAGLKVWNTYRLGADGNSILMTTTNPEECKVVGSSNVLSKREREAFLPIQNFRKMLTEYYDQAIKGAAAGLLIHGDVPMFLVNGNQLDFVCADYDRLDPTDMNSSDLQRENLHYLHGALYTFLNNNLGAEKAAPYIEEAVQYVSVAHNQTLELGPKYLP